MIAPFSHWLSRLSRRQLLHLAVLLLMLVIVLDYLTGPELSLSVLYLIPIIMTAWYVRISDAMVVAGVSALSWMAADIGSGLDYSSHLVPVWNTLVRFALFALVVQLLARIKDQLQLLERLVVTDHLTGLKNRRGFQQLLAYEITRQGRYRRPLTLAYFDLDNFKAVNDTQGHQAGDQVLIRVGQVLGEGVRQVDTPARLGGDEFALLMPEMEVEVAIARLQALRGQLLAAMEVGGWPVTFSIGAVTFVRPVSDARVALETADGFMYQVKQRGKNDLLHRIW